MPSPLTYPGVYIEEIPSGVRTITGVATSITAFIGRAVKGPVNDPVTVTSFGDFERAFGGLAVAYPLSYAVRDFFLNGGSQAIVVRLHHGADGITNWGSGDIHLAASSPGAWADVFTVALDTNVNAEMREVLGIEAGDALFNLTVNEGTNTVEKLINLTLVESARRIDRVLLTESAILRWEGTYPAVTPAIPAAGALTVALSGDNNEALENADYQGDRNTKTGIYALEKADLFNLLCLPPDTRSGDMPAAVYSDALTYCFERRAFLIVDSPVGWTSPATADLATLNLTGQRARNAAIYFPRVQESDPLRKGQLDTFVPCGIIAGIMAKTDATRGVWKAPAGIDASLNGVQGVAVSLTDNENGLLNPKGINCLRAFPVYGKIVWGARTLRGDDQLADEYKYIPVRRIALFIEESLYRGTKWVVFEPNDEPLWAQIRLNIGSFMHELFRKGAFQGSIPREAYFVKCDKETTTQADINLGIVNIVVGFAPLKPAEFVVIKLQQMAGQIQA